MMTKEWLTCGSRGMTCLAGFRVFGEGSAVFVWRIGCLCLFFWRIRCVFVKGCFFRKTFFFCVKDWLFFFRAGWFWTFFWRVGWFCAICFEGLVVFFQFFFARPEFFLKKTDNQAPVFAWNPRPNSMQADKVKIGQICSLTKRLNRFI